MNVVLLVASPRGEMCGVADYADRLAAALRVLGVNANVEFLDRWSFRNLLTIKRRYDGGKKVIFHMQYPTLRLGRSISPGCLPLLLPNPFVTLHEFRLFNILRKLAFLPVSLSSKKIIFSNDEERALFQRYFPLSGQRLTVFPIGNNIPRVAPSGDAQRPEKVVYFGQISRNKGIEFFLDTIARLRSAKSPVQAEIIGALVDSDAAFAQLLKSSSERHEIRLRLNMPPEGVSAALNDSTIALLPFPDGISNKRGSALASLDHGLCVLTTHSDLSPDWLSKVTHRVSSPQGAADLIASIESGEIERHRAPEILAHEMRIRDWNEIAREHLRLYEAAFKRTD